jgi:hypothetical protein
MARKRYSREEIIGKLWSAEVWLAEGVSVAEVARLSAAGARDHPAGRSGLRNLEAPAGSAFRRYPSFCYIRSGCALGGWSLPARPAGSARRNRRSPILLDWS